MSGIWIGLGSNLGDRLGTLEAALAHLHANDVEVRSVSSAWETSPVGPVPQGPYLNAAALVRTDLSPRQLLDRLLAVEGELGRVRDVRWGPRTIDLDLLLYGASRLEEPGLTVPHPYLLRRRFVLAPLVELAPGARHPTDGTRLADALRRLPAEEDVRPVACLLMARQPLASR